MSKRISSTPSAVGELARDFGLADAGRAGEEIGADRLLAVAQAGAGELDRRGQRRRSPCPGRRRRAPASRRDVEHLGIVLRHGLGRDPRHGRDRRLDLLDADRLLALGLGQQHLARAGLVDHVDRLVRQLAVMDVARRQLDRGLDRLVGVADLVEFLEIGLQPLHDLDRVLDRRLVDVDLLEAADQRPVLLEILAIFLIGRRADAAQRALRQRRLQQVRRIHRAAGGRAGADHRVDLVDEEDRASCGSRSPSSPASAALRNRRDSACRRAACPCRARRPSHRPALPALRS